MKEYDKIFLILYLVELLKKEHNLNEKSESLCLKVYGKDEYLLRNCPLIAYSEVQEDLKIYGKIFLVIKKIDDVIMKILPFEKLKLKRSLKREKSFAFEKSLAKRLRSSVKVSSQEINEKFRIEIGQLKFNKNFVIKNGSDTWLR